jgi:hypothetical protein
MLRYTVTAKNNLLFLICYQFFAVTDSFQLLVTAIFNVTRLLEKVSCYVAKRKRYSVTSIGSKTTKNVFRNGCFSGQALCFEIQPGARKLQALPKTSQAITHTQLHYFPVPFAQLMIVKQIYPKYEYEYVY